MSVPAIDTNDGLAVLAGRDQADEPVRFEQAVALQFGAATRTEAKHRAAKHERITKRRARHVLHDERFAGADEKLARFLDAIDVMLLPAAHSADAGMRLTRRTGVDRVEARHPFRIERQNVRLDELERVSRLRLDIDADHIEPSLMIAHARAASAAEQVEEARTPAQWSIPPMLRYSSSRLSVAPASLVAGGVGSTRAATAGNAERSQS